MGALGIDFNVTDTFDATVVDGEIVGMLSTRPGPANWIALERRSNSHQRILICQSDDSD